MPSGLAGRRRRRQRRRRDETEAEARAAALPSDSPPAKLSPSVRAALPAELKLELALLSMRYMSHRLDHVANRIWETRCVSI